MIKSKGIKIYFAVLCILAFLGLALMARAAEPTPPGMATRPAPSLEQTIRTYQAKYGELDAREDALVERLVNLRMLKTQYEAFITQLQKQLAEQRAKKATSRRKKHRRSNTSDPKGGAPCMSGSQQP